jgi:hypothetical protein
VITGATGVVAQIFDDILEVSCPWNPYFVAEARSLRGRWDRERRVWRFAQPESYSAVHDLLEELFHADGSEQPGVDVLLDLDRFQSHQAAISMIEIAGRRIASINHERSEVQLDATASVVHGQLNIGDDFLEWSPGTMIEICRLPEAALQYLAPPDRESFHVLTRHGLKIEDLQRRKAQLQEEIDQLQLSIQRESDADVGLMPPVEASESGRAWRLRCRWQGNGLERRTVHLDGCFTSPARRALTDAEVADLIAGGASACRTCGCYKAARNAGLL